MAKATVRLICKECGLEFSREAIKRNRRDADDWEEWAKKNITMCPHCWAKTVLEEKRRTNAEKVERFLAGHELPDLTGSEKQIAWANNLRIERIANGVNDKMQYNDACDILFANTTEAKFWIDHRFDPDFDFWVMCDSMVKKIMGANK